MNITLEIIAFNIQCCQIIEKSGAHRIELCDNPGEGGTTPSYGLIRAARKAVSIPLFPIIRPRGGDFLYSDEEYSVMMDDVRLCKQSGCDGIVTGLLKPDGTIDTDRTSRLVDLAYPMDVSFHRAFDRTADPFQSMEDIISCGCTRILTSGQQKTAPEGVELIKQLIEQASDRIIILPGSGIRSDNIRGLAENTGATEFHSSARTNRNSSMQYQHPVLSTDAGFISVDETEIKKLLQSIS